MARQSKKSGSSKAIQHLGPFSATNLVDWLVILGVGGLFGFMVLHLGAARFDTNALCLWAVGGLCALSGIGLAVAEKESVRIHRLPLLFLPFALLVVASALWLSPAPWRAWLELIVLAEGGVVLWVLANHCRLRFQLWSLYAILGSASVISIYRAYSQHFQNSGYFAPSGTGVRLAKPEQFEGLATGTFVDPYSFAGMIWILLAGVLVAAIAPRLPVMLRVLFYYLAAMLIGALVFAGAYWVLPVTLLLLPAVLYFGVRRNVVRLVVGLPALLILSGFIGGLYWAVPGVAETLGEELGWSPESERRVLTVGALDLLQQKPVLGHGAGSFQLAFEQRTECALAGLPETPMNDFLLIASQYGLIGAVLLLAPTAWILFLAWRQWRTESFTVFMRDTGLDRMPANKFFAGMGIAGAFAVAGAMLMSFPLQIPALVVLTAICMGTVIKVVPRKWVRLPSTPGYRLAYACAGIGVGILFPLYSSFSLHAAAAEYDGRQQLDQVVAWNIPASGNRSALNTVVDRYIGATIDNPRNVDAWVGLSAAVMQRIHGSPSQFAAIGAQAERYARRATELAPGFWEGWAQLAAAQALQGETGAAMDSLEQASALAPNHSTVLYYRAALLSAEPDTRDAALETVTHSLAINPDNPGARRLQQKLMIP